MTVWNRLISSLRTTDKKITLRLFAPSPIFENPVIQIVVLSTCLSRPTFRLDFLIKDLLCNVITVMLFGDDDASDG